MSQRICAFERNLRNCPCTWEPCGRKGICCECLRYHWGHGELPACFFPPEIEKTYDRSLRRFVEYWGRKSK
ncbi:MAG: DUF6485 family protein [Nitrososphaeria archaeon]|nr:DUF6485 family protein [Nitrososphaeria archaeon]MDW8021558.1 DUF6485 family protein [Nitrososphaerota archaeon]